MKQPPMWAPIETEDGAFVPGPHGVSAASEIYGGISGAFTLIRSGDEAIITDAGFRTTPEYPPGVLDTATDLIDKKGLDVKYIVQTHFHFDHVGNTQYLKERYDAPVVCHPREKEILEEPMMATRTEYIESMDGDPARIAADMNLDGPEDVTFPEDVFEEHWNFPIEVDDTVKDGDVLEVGELEIEVLHTPGHTPGHLSLYNPTSDSLYLTDVMYWPTPIHPHPIGKTDEQLDSIKKCLDLEASSLYPGHELPRYGRPDVEDYLKDMLVKQRQLEKRVLVLLSRHDPMTAPDIHRESFVIKERYDYAHDGWFSYSIACVQAHLRQLQNQGKVERTERGDDTVWTVTDEGRLSEDEIDVHGGYDRRTLSVEDV